jgi:hypothetical protein
VRNHPILITKKTAEILLSVNNLFGTPAEDLGSFAENFKF